MEKSAGKEEVVLTEKVKGTEEAVKEPEKKQSAGPLWIVASFVFLLLLAGAIVLGQKAERQYGNEIIKKLPQTMVTKWLEDEVPISPARPMPSPTEMIVVSSTPILTTVSPTIELTLEPTPPSDRDLVGSSFILPFSNTRNVVEKDLIDLTDWELKVARNEIYARHGRPFVHKDLSCYFAKQSWYTTDTTFTEKSLSIIESTNAVFILNFEKSVKSTLINTDSGCK